MEQRVRVSNTSTADASEHETSSTRSKIVRRNVRILRFEPSPQKPSKSVDSPLTRDRVEHFSSSLHSTVRRIDAKSLLTVVSSLSKLFLINGFNQENTAPNCSPPPPSLDNNV